MPRTDGGRRADSGRSASPSLHEVVERIERRRRLRSSQAVGRRRGAASGRIAGAVPLGMRARRRDRLGRGRAARAADRPLDRWQDRRMTAIASTQEVVRAFARARTVPRRAADALAAPARSPATGRSAAFLRSSRPTAASPAIAGWRCARCLRRPRAAEAMPDVLADPDSLRELVHEIKTPLNAIMGFAEIIEGQYLGPADRGYRERAAEIVRQARLLLTAIDDLDFAAKVHSASGSARERVDLGALVERAAGELRDMAAKRGVEAEVIRARGEVPAAVAAGARRPPAVPPVRCAGRAGRARRATARVGRAGRATSARISISRPAALRGDCATASCSTVRPRAGAVEGGFSLRLARGLRGSPAATWSAAATPSRWSFRAPDHSRLGAAARLCLSGPDRGGPVAQR